MTLTSWIKLIMTYRRLLFSCTGQKQQSLQSDHRPLCQGNYRRRRNPQWSKFELAHKFYEPCMFHGPRKLWMWSWRELVPSCRLVVKLLHRNQDCHSWSGNGWRRLQWENTWSDYNRCRKRSTRHVSSAVERETQGQIPLKRWKGWNRRTCSEGTWYEIQVGSWVG